MKKTTIKIIALCAPLLFASCSEGGILGGAPKLSTKEGVEDITKILKEQFGDKDLYEISVYAEDHLEDGLGHIYTKYYDGSKSFSQTYTETNGVGLGDPSEETSFTYNEKRDGLVKGDKIDISFIPKKVEEAKNIILELTDEYEGFVLYDFSIEFDKDGNYTGDLTLEGTKKGEGTSMQGRNIVTNYYEFDFDINADGTIELDE